MLFSTPSSLLKTGAQLNLNDPLRNGNMLCFPGEGDLIVAGDLHNHQRNFERIQNVADLKRNPQRHVILQELIHGGPLNKDGADWSLDMLLAAIKWAHDFPGQVHFLLANHDLAQVQGVPIMKDGYDLTDRFNRYLRGKALQDVGGMQAAFKTFAYSMPLAAITVTGIFLSHSLPGPREIAGFDHTLLRRELTEQDYQRMGPVYQLVWGRSQTQEVLDTLSKAWWSDLFVCGHQGQDAGYGVIGDRMLIIDSCHNHGTFLYIDLAKQYTMDDLVASVRPLASVA
jgi:hypothetical protein